MKIAYFDCFSGAAGDMIVGALLDAGLEFPLLEAQLAKLNLPGYSLSAEKVRRAGLAGTKFNVAVAGEPQRHRNLADILALIDAAGLSPRATALARAIFQRLGAAEAKVHGIPVEQVHFHEVGAVDSIVDIVAAAVGIDLLGIERAYCSAIPAGSGAIGTAHGVLPVPAPATAELLAGALVALADASATPVGELTTPTAAAVLTTLCGGYGTAPTMTVQAVGCGAGTRERAEMPNLLRVLIGQADEEGSADTVVELSVNLDDCTGQVLGATIEKLLAGGCLDAWCAPIYMKKSRPAWMLSALCPPADVERIEKLLFAETTTLGVRRRTCARSKLLRRHVTVSTPYGPIRVKVAATVGGAETTATPEFADCAAAAEAHGAPVKEVIAAAAAEYRKAAEAQRKP